MNGFLVQELRLPSTRTSLRVFALWNYKARIRHSPSERYCRHLNGRNGMKARFGRFLYWHVYTHKHTGRLVSKPEVRRGEFTVKLMKPKIQGASLRRSARSSRLGRGGQVTFLEHFGVAFPLSCLMIAQKIRDLSLEGSSNLFWHFSHSNKDFIL